jgi:D-xylose transport system permease protein
MARLDGPNVPDAPPEDGQLGTDPTVTDVTVSPEIIATSVPEYLRMSFARIRAGETGILPVIAGLLLVSVLFQWLNGNFLTPGNLVNLLVQAAVFSVLAMGEVYVLLLGEIDLSAGFVAGLGGVVMGELVRSSMGWPWWAAILVGLGICAAIGLLQGTIITRVGLPSFIVTLAGLLFWEGVMLKVLGEGGAILINDKTINDITSANLSPIAGWIVLFVIVGVSGAVTWRRDARRRAAGLVAPPPTLTAIKIAAGFTGGAIIVAICNVDRGRAISITGVPWVVLLVFAILALWTFVLSRTRFGRYIYAIGGNAEAARRAGVNLARIKTMAFVLCSLTAGVAGVIYASRLRSISTAVDGGTLVLYAVAAAVIGGTSLFGGRGKALHGVLGGIVIAAIDNGMGLVGFGAATKFMVTAIVLLVAVTIDALARRGRVAGS